MQNERYGEVGGSIPHSELSRAVALDMDCELDRRKRGQSAPSEQGIADQCKKLSLRQLPRLQALQTIQ